MAEVVQTRNSNIAYNLLPITSSSITNNIIIIFYFYPQGQSNPWYRCPTFYFMFFSDIAHTVKYPMNFMAI